MGQITAFLNKGHTLVKQLALEFHIAAFFLLEFENLGKAFSKAKAVVDKEGIPQFYIRSLTELEDFVKEVKKYIFGVGCES